MQRLQGYVGGQDWGHYKNLPTTHGPLGARGVAELLSGRTEVVDAHNALPVSHWARSGRGLLYEPHRSCHASVAAPKRGFEADRLGLFCRGILPALLLDQRRRSTFGADGVLRFADEAC